MRVGAAAYAYHLPHVVPLAVRGGVTAEGDWRDAKRRRRRAAATVNNAAAEVRDYWNDTGWRPRRRKK